MAKPDPALLDPARYPFSCTVETRYSHLDTQRHVNNAAMAAILQEARAMFHYAAGFDVVLSNLVLMNARFSVDFLGQAYHPDSLENFVAVTAVGHTSHTIGQVVVRSGVPIAFAQSVMVCVSHDRATPNPPALLEAVKPWMISN